MATNKQTRMLDKQIERIFYSRCAGLQIPILRISEIFAAGQKAAADGLDIETAVVDTTLRIAADAAVK